jgi:hypothetical protein
MKRKSCSLKTDKHHAAGSPNPRIGMGQNWEPVLTEDKLKVALAQKAEARLTAGELENRLKELRARLKSLREQVTPSLERDGKKEQHDPYQSSL